jgi:hypothetical protein
MTPDQQHRATFIGISFLILYFGYLYHRSSKPTLSSMQVIMHLVLGVIAFVATIMTGQYINNEGLLSGDKDQFVHVLTLFAIFVVWIWVFRSLKRMI